MAALRGAEPARRESEIPLHLPLLMNIEDDYDKAQDR